MSINPKILAMITDLENNNLNALEVKYKEYFKNQTCQSLLKQIVTDAPTVSKNFSGIEGLWYIENYLSEDELNMIKNKINEEIDLVPITKSSASRKVAHYGYYYLYDRSGLKEAPKIPNYLESFVLPERINKLVNEDLVNVPFEQLIINEYLPGQQIAFHIDHVKQFGPMIACITVGQSVPIKFKYGSVEKIINVKEGSMYIMTEDARYKWQHSLRNATTNNRYSLTYRTINKN